MSDPDTELQRKRVKTLKKRHSAAERRAWAQKAGKASPTKFTSESGRAAIQARWAKKRAAEAEINNENK